MAAIWRTAASVVLVARRKEGGLGSVVSKLAGCDLRAGRIAGERRKLFLDMLLSQIFGEVYLGSIETSRVGLGGSGLRHVDSKTDNRLFQVRALVGMVSGRNMLEKPCESVLMIFILLNDLCKFCFGCGTSGLSFGDCNNS